MNLESLVLRLIQTDVEEPCIEFKGNKNDSEMIAKDISALSNSTIAYDKPVAFMVWGVDDIGHDIVGTTFNPDRQKVGNEDLINWLHQNITNNVDYHFEETSVLDKRVVVLTVNRPIHSPVRFRNVAYIRDGSHTKPLDKLPLLERKFWENMNRSDYETSVAKPDLSESEALSLLDIDCIVSRLRLQRPTDSRRAMEILIENGFVTMQPDGGFGITVLGAILFAKDLHDFKPLLNKTVRIVQYEGSEKTTIARQYECEKGYAVQFDRIIETVSMLIPAVQRILPDGQMAQFYGIPSFSTGMLTDSKTLDSQSAHERTITSLLPAMVRTSALYGMGTLDTGAAFSLEQLVIDDEMVSMESIIVRGAVVDDETMSFDTIAGLGEGDSFLEHRSTVINTNRVSKASLFDRDPINHNLRFNKRHIEDVAHNKVLEVLSTHKVEPLPGAQEKALRELISNADSEYRYSKRF